jgi:hypothetical protein
MHAETLAFADKTIVLSEHEVSIKSSCHGNTIIFKNILTNEKSPKIITLNYKIINFPTYIG